MKKKWIHSLQFVILLIIGGTLFWMSLRKISLELLFEELKQGEYIICIPVFMISATGYFFRIMRWKMMLNQMGEQCRKRSLYAALCMGYAVSFVVPRLGELSRALIIKRTDGVKVDYTILSIIAERLLDTFALAFLLLLSTLVYHDVLSDLVQSKEISAGFHQMGFGFWLLILAAILLVVLVIYFTMRRKWIQSVVNRYLPVTNGLKKSILIPGFWFYTGGIWICYFLMTYLWFFLFDNTSQLTWKDAFIVMVVGSVGRSVPVQGGGMGAYHFVVSKVLFLLGLSLVTGNALAIVIHGAQAAFTFVTGTIAYLWMLFDRRSAKDILPAG